MATYIMLSTLTDDGSETLKENPSRLKEANKEIEGMGVKIMSQYATLGPYDFRSTGLLQACSRRKNKFGRLILVQEGPYLSEDRVEHRLRQTAGLRVLAAGMIGNEETKRGGSDFISGPMPERD